MKCSATELLQLGKEILSKDSAFYFRAKGRSMLPLIHEGDILFIEPCSLKGLCIGDIVFYQTHTRYPIVHRIINEISRDGKNILLIKGDYTFGKGDEVLFDDVIGKVTKVKRGKLSINLNKLPGRVVSLLFFGIACFLMSARRIASRLLRRLYSIALYRRLRKIIMRPRLAYSWERLDESGGYLLVLAGTKRVGSATITYSADDDAYHGWWIFDMWVNWWYRALGIGRGLTRRLCRTAYQRGASEVRLLVFEDNLPAISLYKKEGFFRVHMELIDNELYKESLSSGRRRIIMQKDLRSSAINET